MRIFIDIGHPAHVHYFKNFIRIMSGRNHEFFLSARDKDVTVKLLNEYNIPYSPRGKGRKSIPGKLGYLFYGDVKLYSFARAFKPDIFLSFASPYAAHAAFFSGKPHIAIDDTEAAKFNHLFYIPFTETILNPLSYKKAYKQKQIKFDSFIELSYLHPEYFKPDITVLKDIGLSPGERFILLRFVGWGANHDYGQRGLNSNDKEKLVHHLSQRYKLVISSETPLPEKFKSNILSFPPEKIHDIMAFAELFIGEGATMASECAMIGTPAIYVNTISAGTIEEQEKQGLLFIFRNFQGVLEKADQILSDVSASESFKMRSLNLIKNKIDFTSFLVWFVENYPESRKIMLQDPSFQEKFKNVTR